MHTDSFINDAQSLPNKLAELNSACREHRPNLVAVTETWFTSNMSDNELAISFMALLRRDRSSIGGGVALHYNPHLTCLDVSDKIAGPPDTMCCSPKLQSGESCAIGIIYRPPSATDEYDDQLLAVMQRISTRIQTQVLIMEDFNHGDPGTAPVRRLMRLLACLKACLLVH